MFPHIDDAVLQDNPDFANLYNKLTNVILNPDGTTKEDPAAKEQQRVKDELHNYRLKAAKHHILTRAVATASPPDPQPPRSSSNLRTQQPRPQQHSTALPEPLLDLLILLPPLLDSSSNSLSAESTSLLLSSPPLSDLDALLPDLANLVSSHLRSSALSLARITNPSTNPSYLHRHIPSLAPSARTLAETEAQSHRTLSASRLRTLTSLTGLLEAHTTCLTRLIRSLEAKHGVVARNLDLRATDASLRARHTQASVEMALYGARSEIYTPEAMGALTAYASHLRDAKIRVGEKINGLTAELADYGVGVEGGRDKERTMREMARVYRDMARQMEDTKGDLDRLQRVS